MQGTHSLFTLQPDTVVVLMPRNFLYELLAVQITCILPREIGSDVNDIDELKCHGYNLLHATACATPPPIYSSSTASSTVRSLFLFRSHGICGTKRVQMWSRLLAERLASNNSVGV